MTIPESVWTSADNPQHPASPAYWLREMQAERDELQVPFNKATERKMEKQATFLAALVRQAGITLAAGIAETTIHAYHKWCTEDPIFKSCLDKANEAVGETLVAEAHRRGVEGVVVILRDRQGNVIGEERKHSDGLLITLLRALDKRFAKSASNDTNSRDEWRKALAKMADNPEAIQLLEQLADVSYGEKSSG